jgi:hypothetical protein
MSQFVQDDVDIMADVVVQTIKSAIAPLVARITALEGIAALVPRKDYGEDVGALRQRLADMPSSFEKAISGVFERLARLETKLAEASPVIGPPGEPGAVGAVGPAGPQGERGEAGAQGEAGPQGPAGSIGEKGETGLRGDAGPAGINGKDVDLSLYLGMQANLSRVEGEWAAFKAWQAGAIGDALAKMQPPEPDPLVLDGLVQKHLQTQHKAVDEDAIVVRVKAAVLQEIPAPQHGKDGKPGEPGPPGPSGAVGPQGPAGEPGATGQKGESGPMGPAGNTGGVGPQGDAGRDGAEGAPGSKGVDGKDGVGFSDALVNRAGHLVLTFTNGETKDVGLVLGKDVDAVEVAQIIRDEVAKIPRPKDGADGQDGIGFDDLDLTFDERKGFVLKAVSGERVKEWPLPLQWDAGTWKHGVIYPKGANVTDHGAYYTALRATSARPGQPGPESRAWRLIVKKGQDGKPGKDGKDSD